MGTNFNELRGLIKEGAHRAFSSIQAEHPDEEFYAFALYTDDSAGSLLPAASSEQGYQRVVQKYGFSDPRELKYLRWTPAEWAYEAFGSHFHDTGICLDAQDRYSPDVPNAFTAFRQQFLATLINGLADLEAEGFFGVGEAREKLTVFATIRARYG